MSEENVVVSLETPAEIENDQNTVEQAPTEPVAEEIKAAEDQPTEVEPEKKPGKNSFDRKIDRLYKSAAEQKARADYLEQQLQELKPKNVEPQGAPRIEDFDDIEVYSKALGKFEYEMEKQSEIKAKEQFANQMFVKQTQASWDEAVNRGIDKYDDFDEVVPNLEPRDAGLAAILNCENSEDVAYFLFKNKDSAEVQKILTLNQFQQVVAITKLSVKLANEPQADKKPSKAPAPILPLSGKSSGISELPSDNDDTATWILKERARTRKAGA